MKRNLLILIISLLFLSTIATAYEDYAVSDSDFSSGYAKDLVPGDKFTVTIDGQKYFVQALSIYQNLVYISVSGLSNEESLSTGDNKQYEITFDNYYDISVKLNSVKLVSPQEKSASITIKKIHEEIPAGTNLPDTCPKYYTCPDGTKVKECEPSGQGCLCKSISSLCPKKESEPCEKFYTCPDGSKVQYCFIQEQRDSEGNIVSAGCGCKSNPASLCPQKDTCTKYYTCPDGTKIKECEISGTGCLCQQNPLSLCLGECNSDLDCNDKDGCTVDKCEGIPKKCAHTKQEGCAVGTKCFNQGIIYKLGEERYYCDVSNKGLLQKEDGNICNNAYECLSNICEKNLCGKYCEGCKDKNNNCIPFGTRTETQYCDIDKTIKNQKYNEISCNNNYECTSNVCVNSKCIEPNLIQKVLNWFKRLFGGK